MHVDIWSDVVCPWCYIGERRFEAAVAESGVDVEVRYRAFQLDPTAPVGTTTPLAEAYAAKFGGSERAGEIIAKVTRVAAAAGLGFHLDIARRANTLAAHRLIWWAGQPGSALDQTEIVHALMHAYFSEGRDVGDHTVLAEIAVAHGADAERVAAFLASSEGTDAVAEDLESASDRGITAVPTFVVEDTWAIPGAQDREVFTKMLRKLADKTSVR